jgi:hypothetical protein
MKKKLITVLCLLAPMMALAVPAYVGIWTDETISVGGRNEVLAKLQQIGGSAAPLNPAEMPRWRKVSNTNIVGRIVSIRTDIMGVKGFKNYNMATFETWKENHLSVSDRSKVRVGAGNCSWKIFVDGGLEPVKEE